MKRFLLLVIALLAIISLAGCGNGDNGGSDNNTNGNGNGNEDTGVQWLAYKFGEKVKPSSGGSGNIESFSMKTSYTEDGQLRQFQIDATYLGSETAQISTIKQVMDTTTFSSTTENITTSLAC